MGLLGAFLKHGCLLTGVTEARNPLVKIASIGHSNRRTSSLTARRGSSPPRVSNPRGSGVTRAIGGGA